ncbi:MAG: hypothetical protein JO252_20250, partial [Planctomycetaceae bacterium]|nr:hypothetical protein [Planctomycetaceae bacterium]
MNVHAILGDRGAVARRRPGNEARPQQRARAAAVAHALAAPSHLVVEAGTGVGKSFADLIPRDLRRMRRIAHPATPPGRAGRHHGGRRSDDGEGPETQGDAAAATPDRPAVSIRP